MASVREIAKQAGVSKTTVAMVLRHQDGVSDSMRQRVEEAINQLRTLEEARVMEEKVAAGNGVTLPARDDQPCSILLLHPANIFTSAVFREIVRGIQAAVSLYHLQLHLAFNDPSHFNSNFEEIYLSNPVLRPKGLLVLGARVSEPVVERACQLGIATVMVGRNMSGGLSSIGRNEEEVAAEATGYLLDLGHRQIAFLGSSDKYSYIRDRQTGYRRAFTERGLSVPDDLLLSGFNEQVAASRLLARPDITAALFVNELYATKVVPLLQASERAIPEDLSVICFDDTSLSENFDPPLTAVSFPFYQEGFWAVRVLYEQIRQPFIQNIHMVLRASLIKRKSCAPPKTYPGL